jgi:hypothetical protein
MVKRPVFRAFHEFGEVHAVLAELGDGGAVSGAGRCGR